MKMTKDEILQSLALDEKITADLSTIFEDVDVSQNVKDALQTVFENKLNEAYDEKVGGLAEQVTEKLEALVEEKSQARIDSVKESLYEDVSTYFNHLGDKWSADNEQAITYSLGGELYESFVLGAKKLLVDHNISIPADQVDVVAELNEEIVENQEMIRTLTESEMALKADINGRDKRIALMEASAGLTDTQIEKLEKLTESVEFNENFANTLSGFVELVSNSKANTLNEDTQTEDDKGLNYQPETINEDTQPAKKASRYSSIT